MKRLPALVALLSLLIPMAFAQSVTTNGTPAFNSFSGGPDVINDGNLNMHYTAPAFARAGRGMPFSLSLPVDNGAWYTYQDLYGNWHFGADFSTAQPAGVLAIGTVFYYTRSYQCSDGAGGHVTYTRYYASAYQSPDNTSHKVGGVCERRKFLGLRKSACG